MEEMKVHMEEEKQKHSQEFKRLSDNHREEILSLATQNQQLQVWHARIKITVVIIN